MNARLGCLALLLGLLCACSSGTGSDIVAADADSSISHPDDVQAADQVVFPDLGPTEVTKDVPVFHDLSPADTHVPGCEEGEGCFLDHCLENSDCLSGWCVQHLGEGVCTIPCQDECPDGWNCKMLGGLGPDPIFLCISGFGNLCKPCAQAEDCISEQAGEDVCVSYGEEGAFCGGQCAEDKDCPWGFSCLTVETVDGASLQQCVIDAGACPCSTLSVDLGLWTPCKEESEWGSCPGKRFCTEEGLSGCDAALPAEETCNAVDDDCDGATDEPLEEGGDYVNLCNDDNECTKDTCTGSEGCAYELLLEGECIDGDACTVGDHCVEGVCVGAPVECDDSNPCTEDTCDGLGGCAFENIQTTCDDMDPCTLGDLCTAGVCAGTPVDCDCVTDEDCAVLEDDDLCNGTLVCNVDAVPYRCMVAPDTEVTCQPPEGEDAFCLTAQCEPLTGVCSEVPANPGLPCDDGDLCTWEASCVDGQCSGGSPLNCNDGNPCTDDGCEPDTGCTYQNNSYPCEDGDTCTVGEQCQDGLCVGNEDALACDDGNPCTDDQCVNGQGCVHTPNQSQCDDGNPCTDGDHCEGGWCVFTGAIVCADQNQCTADSCDPTVGCVFGLHDGPCNDDDLCTTGDHCHLGQCINSGTLACNDNNLCTDDSCNPQVGCTFLPNQEPCDDGNQCTTGDHCENGSCTFGEAVVCSETTECTMASCDPSSGCVYTQHNGPCDDNDLCTTGDVCTDGECGGSGLFSCDDGNLCTTDACDPVGGCSFVPFEGLCDDEDPCTGPDLCINGWCNGTPKDCDDNNPCTDSLCNGDGDCVAWANDDPCNDEDVCTMVDQCFGMECLGGQPLDCNDANPCTDDSCDPVGGCQYENNALPCPGGQCAGGECVLAASCIEYSTGNDAYWFERNEGFRDVCIGSGATEYTYNAQLKQYRNGDLILLPNKVGSGNGAAVSATNFYGFAGGSPSDSSYHWDAVANAQAPQPSVWDVTGMFISPLSGNQFNYCKTLNWNSPDCNNTIIDGPVETLAYPNHSPKNGTYNLNQSAEQIDAGVLVGGQKTWISQQQLDVTAHPSYCVATYGRGWRLPTDIEMGHTTDSHGWNAGIDPSYNAPGGSYHSWSSSRYLPIAKGYLFILWPLGTGQNGYWDGNGVSANNQTTRCVFPGVD
jgi:hypothetical protein